VSNRKQKAGRIQGCVRARDARSCRLRRVGDPSLSAWGLGLKELAQAVPGDKFCEARPLTGRRLCPEGRQTPDREGE